MSEHSEFAGRKVLYFDDEPLQVKNIADTFKKFGMGVDRVMRPKDAILKLQTTKYDLVVLDIRIATVEPDDLDQGTKWIRYGVQFLKNLRSGEYGTPAGTKHSVPALAITAVVSTGTVDSIEELGREDDSRFEYLAKPVDLDNLPEKLGKLLS